MRAHSAQDDAIFAGPGQATFFRAWIKDAGGTFRDLTSLGNGVNLLDGVEIHESIDEPSTTCTLSLKREWFKLSLAADVAGSILNQLGGGTRLVELNREVKVEAQIQPLGVTAPVGTAWQQIFYGRVEKVDSGPDPIRVECRDLMSRLMSRWIKTERAYGVWQATRRAATGYVVCPSTDNPASPSSFWQWTSATGTTGAAEPAWPAGPTPGVTTVADNGGTWTCIAAASGGTPMETLLQLLLDDNTAPGTYALYTPTSPAFLMRDYNQRKESLQSAMQTIANCVAWDLRYRWDDGAQAFRLTLLNPNRRTLGPGDSQYLLPSSKYSEITSYERDLSGVRNSIEVPWLDPSNLDANGNPSVAVATSTDAASIASFDEQFMSVAEGAGSPINTAAQAQAMADAICADLAQPLVSVPVAMEFTWWLQLHDAVTLKKDNVHADADQVMAITTITHTLKGDGTARTELGLRAKPCSGHWSWHRNAGGAPGLNGGAARQLGPRTPAAVAAGATIAGGTITWHIPQTLKDRYDTTEVYLSTLNGFTPATANRVHIGRAGRVDLTGLTAGTTYYARIAHRDLRGNLGAFSAQISFVAGYMPASTLTPFLRSAGRYKVTADLATTGSGADIAFGTKVFDALNQATGNAFAPAASGVWRFVSRVRLQGANVQVGFSATLVVVENNGGVFTVVGQGPEAVLVSDVAAGTDAITCTLDVSVPVVAGRSYSLRYYLLAGFSPVSLNPTYALATVKADFTAGSGHPVAGSYVEFQPVPQ